MQGFGPWFFDEYIVTHKYLKEYEYSSHWWSIHTLSFRDPSSLQSSG